MRLQLVRANQAERLWTALAASITVKKASEPALMLEFWAKRQNSPKTREGNSPV